VVALREIADETVALDHLKNSLIKGHQKHVEPDEPEEEIVELMAGEHDWARGVDNSLDGDDAMSEGEELGEDDDIAGDMDADPDKAFGMTEDDVVGRDADGDV